MSFVTLLSDNLTPPTSTWEQYWYTLKNGVYVLTNVTTGGATFTKSNIGTNRMTVCQRGLKKPAGFLRPQPVKHCSVSGTCPSVTASVYRVLGTQLKITKTVSGPLAAFLGLGQSLTTLPVSPGDSGLFNSLYLEALAKQHSSQAEVGMMLAEAGETLSFLASPFRGLAKYFSKMAPRRTLRRRKSRMDYAADAWLQYRYAVMPLVYDVDTIRNLVVEKLQRDFEVRRVGSVATDKGVVSEKEIHLPCPAVSSFYVHGKQVDSVEKRIGVRLWFSQHSRCAGSLLGLDVTSLPGLVWELVPYSFVLDWFVGVGTYLSAIRPVPSQKPLGHSYFVRSSASTEISLTGCSMTRVPSAAYPVSPCHNVHRTSRDTYTRNFDGPSDTSFPPISWGLSHWKRQLDSVSLLWGQIKRPHGRR